MRLAVAIVALLLLAAPAQAQFSGPALDGDRVVWGAEAERGRTALLERRDGVTRELWRSPRMADPIDGANGVAASSGWTAISILSSTDRIVASRKGGPFREVLPGASGPVAAEGDGLALSGGRGVYLYDERGRVRLARLPKGTQVAGDIEMTRRHVAWSTFEGIFVARRSDGEVVRHLERSDLGGGFVTDFGLDDNGDIAVCVAFGRGSRVFTLSDGKLRRLALVRSSVAIAEGRVAFFTKRRLAVETLRGRRIATFGRFRTAVSPAYVDLDADRVAWRTYSVTKTRPLRG